MIGSGGRQREAEWRQALREVDQIREGGKVDKGIREAVAALRAWGLPTSGSCQGHPHWGYPSPWIDVAEPLPPGLLKSSIRTKEGYLRRNLRHQVRMIELLREFYRARSVPFDAVLVPTAMGLWGGFRLQSVGWQTVDLLPSGQRDARRRRYRREMNDFARFLKHHFMAGSKIGKIVAPG